MCMVPYKILLLYFPHVHLIADIQCVYWNPCYANLMYALFCFSKFHV